jgi:hypothetical protein
MKFKTLEYALPTAVGTAFLMVFINTYFEISDSPLFENWTEKGAKVFSTSLGVAGLVLCAYGYSGFSGWLDQDRSQ